MSFADLAFERLNKTAPELTSLVISFSDLSEELGEDSVIKLGVFTLRSGGTLFFVPVLSKGTNVYPIDSIFSQEDKKFFPVSKLGIQKIINSVQTGVGKGSKIPPGVDRNPSLRELVEPPRTGKYTYAGSRVGEILATSSEHLKKAMLEKLAEDKELTKGLHKMGFDMKEILSALKPIEKVALEIAPEVQVITDGEDLEDDVVQMILDQGYAIIGEHREPRIVVEAGLNNEGYSTLNAAQPGCAYEIVLKNGTTRLGFVPKTVPRNGLGLLPDEGSSVGFRPVGQKSSIRSDKILVLENGDYCYDTSSVIIDNPRDYIEVVKNVIDSGNYSDLEALESEGYSGPKFLLVTPKGCMGPFTLRSKTITSSGVILSVEGCHCDYSVSSITIVPNMEADVCVDGKDIYVPASAKALILDRCVTDELEKDIHAAIRRKEALTHSLMKEAHVLSYDDVEFFYDGRAFSKEAKLAEELVVKEGLSKSATLNLIKKAKENSKITFYMSKQASGATPTPFPQYGQAAPEDDGDIMSSRTKKQVTGIAASIKKAMGTGDPQAVEATIITEFAQDPNMYETVETYLPDIKEAVDKLGRAILLFRINSEKISDDLQSEELSNLMTSLRNTFKTLGDNSIRLENVTNNVREHGQ